MRGHLAPGASREHYRIMRSREEHWLWSSGGNSVDKELAVQAQGPSSDPQHAWKCCECDSPVRGRGPQSKPAIQASCTVSSRFRLEILPQ